MKFISILDLGLLHNNDYCISNCERSKPPSELNGGLVSVYIYLSVLQSGPVGAMCNTKT